MHTRTELYTIYVHYVLYARPATHPHIHATITVKGWYGQGNEMAGNIQNGSSNKMI